MGLLGPATGSTCSSAICNASLLSFSDLFAMDFFANAFLSACEIIYNLLLNAHNV